MSQKEDQKVELAIALFERHYPERRVEVALSHCETLESAIEWLENDAGRVPSTASSNATMITSSSIPKENRKRMNKKSSDNMPILSVNGVEEPCPAPETISALPSPLRAQPHRTSFDACQQGSSDGIAISNPTSAAVEDQTSGIASSASMVEATTIAASASTHLASSSLAEVPISAPVRVPPLEPAWNDNVGSEDSSVRLCPMQPEAASAWWEKAKFQWQRAGWKRSASSADDVPGTPTKKFRKTLQSPIGSCEFPSSRDVHTDTPPASLFSGEGIEGSASATDGGGSESRSRRVQSPSSSSLPAADQSSASLAQGLVHSPRPGNLTSHRRSLTPGTSPRAQMRYNKTAETCSICFEDVERGYAVCLGCTHGWYCGNCMVKHAEARLEVGDAHVACPECGGSIAECNLRKLLPTEVMERLLSRSLEQAVSSAADLWACPTPNCPMRVALEDDELPVLQCTACRKESCLHCGAQPYHKGLSCEEFAERSRARGRRKIEAKKAEDSFKQWMQETGTKQCPTCGIAITKQDIDSQRTQYQECHKMFCRNCNTKFCFKCTKILTDKISCGCSIDAHGFVDPRTGKRVEHLQKVQKAPSKLGRQPVKQRR